MLCAREDSKNDRKLLRQVRDDIKLSVYGFLSQ